MLLWWAGCIVPGLLLVGEWYTEYIVYPGCISRFTLGWSGLEVYSILEATFCLSSRKWFSHRTLKSKRMESMEAERASDKVWITVGKRFYQHNLKSVNLKVWKCDSVIVWMWKCASECVKVNVKVWLWLWKCESERLKVWMWKYKSVKVWKFES